MTDSHHATRGTCATCAHGYKSTAAINAVECRERPPQLVSPAPGQVVAAWPQTAADACCHRWRGKLIDAPGLAPVPGVARVRG